MSVAFLLAFLVAFVSCSEEPTTQDHRSMQRNYFPEFLNKLNPNTWIEYYLNSAISSRLYLEDIKQKALFNVVKCLVIDDRDNCKSLLDIAEHMFREKPPATVSYNQEHTDVTPATSQ